MQERMEIGKISFDIDKKQLEMIAASGKLGAFVDQATALFKQNLKAELVSSVSSGSTALVKFEDGEYGTIGPIGPIPQLFMELEAVVNKMNDIEVLFRNFRR